MYAHRPPTAGKTAPRLIRDFSSYDPRYKAKTGFNVLTDIPEWEDNEFKVDTDQTKGHCKHKWLFDEEHSTLLEQGRLPTQQSVFSVVAHCALCRSHFTMMLDFISQIDEDIFLPCPNVDAPLHHFLHKPGDSQDLPSIQPGAVPLLWFDKQVFQCSSPTCAATLAITFRPPRLQPMWIRQLTDKTILKERADTAIKSDPERFEGHAPSSPADVLSNLRTYILNGMESDDQKVIKGANKKWLLCFGDSCTDLLRYIGFQRDVGLDRNADIEWADNYIRRTTGCHRARDPRPMPLLKKHSITN